MTHSEGTSQNAGSLKSIADFGYLYHFGGQGLKKGRDLAESQDGAK